METPLLERRSSDQTSLIGDDGDYLEAKDLKAWWRIFCIESVKLWRIGGVMAFQLICQLGTTFVATIFVGHLGDVELSAFSVAVLVVGTFCYGFLYGMGSALETLSGQAFGAGQVHLLGIYMQRSIIILFFTCILFLPVFIFATPILKLIGVTNEIAIPAGLYTLLTIPELFSLCLAFPCQKFLQAQSKVVVLGWISGFGLIAQIFWCWLFISVFEWGSIGAALAVDLTAWCTAIMQFVYVVGWCKDGWKGCSWAAFKDIWSFVKLSLESAVMLCLDIWYVVSITLLAGNLDNAVTAVGSLSICMNINQFETMFFIGINAAISVRVSNELGMGRPRATKYSVYVTAFQSLLIGIFCMMLVLATRNYFAVIFTDSEEMIRVCAHLSGLLAITMLFNSVQLVISGVVPLTSARLYTGVAIGGGWQGLVAYINLACYYIFGLPLGYILGYVANFGVLGIWGGMIAGTFVQTILLVFVLYRTNWNKEVEKTTERMRKWGGKHNEIESMSY